MTRFGIVRERTKEALAKCNRLTEEEVCLVEFFFARDQQLQLVIALKIKGERQVAIPCDQEIREVCKVIDTLDATDINLIIAFDEISDLDVTRDALNAEVVIASAACEGVVASATKQRVVAKAAVQDVINATAKDTVIACTGIHILDAKADVAKVVRPFFEVDIKIRVADG